MATLEQIIGADAWENCLRSDSMLRMLRDCNYRNAEKLEQFLDWLSEQVKGSDEEETRRKHFGPHKGYSQQLEKDVKEGRMTWLEARRRRFDSASSRAFYAISNLTWSRRVVGAYHVAKRQSAAKGKEPSVPAIENSLKLAALREQADKLREIIGNPFALPVPAEDFYCGNGFG